MHFSFFPALFEKPGKIRFETQEANETIELFLRRHFITNVPWILSSIIGFFLPLFVVQLDILLGFNIVSQIPTLLLVGGLIIFYLLILAYIIENFLFWYYNIYIVTNIHLVDIALVSILSRSVKEVELNDIEDVTSKINGVIRSLFNYGDVLIKTAAQQEVVSFGAVPRPDFVADRIQDLRLVFIEGGG